jgi:hypothetical protein
MVRNIYLILIILTAPCNLVYLEYTYDSSLNIMTTNIKIFNTEKIYNLGIIFYNTIQNRTNSNFIILFNSQPTLAIEYFQIINQLDLSLYFSISNIWIQDTVENRDIYPLVSVLDGVINFSIDSDIWKIYHRVAIMAFIKRITLYENTYPPTKDFIPVLQCQHPPIGPFLECRDVILCSNKLHRRKISQFLDLTKVYTSIPIDLFKHIDEERYFISPNEGCNIEQSLRHLEVIERETLYGKELIASSIYGLTLYSEFIRKSYGIFETISFIFSMNSFNMKSVIYIDHGDVYSVYHINGYDHWTISECGIGSILFTLLLFFLIKSKIESSEGSYVDAKSYISLPNFNTRCNKDIKYIVLACLLAMYSITIRGVDRGFLSLTMYLSILGDIVSKLVIIFWYSVLSYRTGICTKIMIAMIYHSSIHICFLGIWSIWSRACYNVSIYVILSVLIIFAYIITTNSLLSILYEYRSRKKYAIIYTRIAQMMDYIVFSFVIVVHVTIFSLFYVKWLYPLVLSIMADIAKDMIFIVCTQIFIISTFYSILIMSVNRKVQSIKLE